MIQVIEHILKRDGIDSSDRVHFRGKNKTVWAIRSIHFLNW